MTDNNELTYSRRLLRRDLISPYRRAERDKFHKKKKRLIDRSARKGLISRLKYNHVIKWSSDPQRTFLSRYRLCLLYTQDILEISATEVEFLLFCYAFEDGWEAEAALERFLTTAKQRNKLFQGLVRKGMIVVLAAGVRNSTDPIIRENFSRAVYKLTHKAKHACGMFVKYLLGEESIPKHY